MCAPIFIIYYCTIEKQLNFSFYIKIFQLEMNGSLTSETQKIQWRNWLVQTKHESAQYAGINLIEKYLSCSKE